MPNPLVTAMTTTGDRDKRGKLVALLPGDCTLDLAAIPVFFEALIGRSLSRTEIAEAQRGPYLEQQKH